jgi:hypothetical protein
MRTHKWLYTILLWTIASLVTAPVADATCQNFYIGCSSVAGGGPQCPYGPSGKFVLNETNTGYPHTLPFYYGACIFCSAGCAPCIEYMIRTSYYDCNYQLVIEDIWTCCRDYSCWCPI